MKLALVVTLTLVSLSSSAQDYSAEALGNISVKKAKDFLSSGDCSFAAGTSLKNTKSGKQYAAYAHTKPGYIIGNANEGAGVQVLCVKDATLDKGTARAKKGCFVGWKRIDTKTFGDQQYWKAQMYVETYGEDATYDASIIVGSTCNKEVVTNILKRPGTPKLNLKTGKVVLYGNSVWQDFIKQTTGVADYYQTEILADKFDIAPTLLKTTSHANEAESLPMYSGASYIESESTVGFENQMDPLTTRKYIGNGFASEATKYYVALKKENKIDLLNGKMVLQFHAEDGKTTDFIISKDTMKIPQLSKCITDSAKGYAWHSTGTNLSLTYKFTKGQKP